MGWFQPVFSVSLPDQFQPGRIVRIESYEPSGYDSGNVEERTFGCAASPKLYNPSVNQVYKGEASAEGVDRPVSSTRPPLLCAEKGASHLWYEEQTALLFLPRKGMDAKRALLRQPFIPPRAVIGIWVP